MNTVKRVQNVIDWLVEDIMALTDEELNQELIDAGLDPKEEADKVRKAINLALDRHKRSQNTGAATMVDGGIYEWHERYFVSDQTRFQKGGPPPMTGLFDGLRPEQVAAILVTPPRYDPFHCGLSYGAWAEFPLQNGDTDNGN